MKNILLIDSQAYSRTQLKDILAADYQVFEADTGEEAIAIASDNQVDLILLDLERPDYQGPEICSRLKEECATKFIPLILLSGFNQKENLVNGLHAGAEDYMTKPIYASELSARIETHLRSRGYYAELEKEDLLMLLELTEIISVTRNPRKILTTIVQKMAEAIDVSRCSIISLSDEGELVVKASNDLPPSREIKLDLENYPEIRQALTTHRPVILQDVVDSPLMEPVREKIKGLANHSIFVVPIIKKQNVIGTFFLRTMSSYREGVSNRVVKLCHLVANISGSALENAVLFETMQSSRKLLQDLAQRDSLTGLYNHQQFHTRFEEEFSRSRRYGLPLSCIFADIDDFKGVNDQFGHVVGDVVLKQIGRLLESMFRKSDITARYGGEEFAVILPNTDAEGAKDFSARLQTVLQDLRIPQLEGQRITMSVGVATYPDGAFNSYLELLRQADQAMYAEKTRKKVGEKKAG